MRRRDDPSDLTDAEWKILEPLIPKPKEGGRPRTTEMREVLNAMFYVDRTGCQWRALPHDFPSWSTVWSYFRAFRNDGTRASESYRIARAGARERGTRTDAKCGHY